MNSDQIAKMDEGRPWNRLAEALGAHDVERTT